MRIVPPVRKSYDYHQRLDGSPDRIFPLLCPVRECEWVADWHPLVVISTSGVAEPGCVFVTADQAPMGGDPREAIWVVVAHEPSRHHVAMVKTSPGYLMTRLWITVRPDRAPRSSRAHVRYEYTALGPEGEAFVRAHTLEKWTGFMRAWEQALNDYLRRATDVTADASERST